MMINSFITSKCLVGFGVGVDGRGNKIQIKTGFAFDNDTHTGTLFVYNRGTCASACDAADIQIGIEIEEMPKIA